MYTSYWGLKEKPFENTPDPRFLYRSSKHEEAISRLLYAVLENKGGALLTGEYGSGKTLVARVLLLEKWIKSQAILIFNPRLEVEEFLQEIAHQLCGGHLPQSKRDLLNRISASLSDNYRDHKKTILAVDEAQAILSDEIFEELRLLLNLQGDDHFLLSLILIGQPELRGKVDRIPQLKQRLAIRYHLTGLEEKECQDYIHHRLRVAGMPEGKATLLFTEGCHRIIYRASSGLPRNINNICDMSLLVGYDRKAQAISEEMVAEVLEDLGLSHGGTGA